MNVQDFGDYAFLLSKNFNVMDSVQNILMSFNFFTNNNILLKNSKYYRVFSKIVNEKNTSVSLKQELQLTGRQRLIQKLKTIKPFLTLNQPTLLCEFFDL
jgi:hypothetical protein